MSVIIQLPEDINRFCRTCMNITEDNKSSFENYIILDHQPTELSKMLQTVTSLNMTPEDDLPKTLCPVCTEHVITAYKFINQSKDVDTNLRNLLTLSEQTEEELEDLKQEDNPLISPQKNESEKVDKNDYNCQVCSQAFKSYYQLSMHLIDHNTEKNLLERFLENQNSVSSKIPVDVELDINTVKLVLERKSSCKSETIMKNSNTIQETYDISMEIVENLEKITNKITIECKICNKKFNGRKDLISHICKPVNNTQKDSNRKLLTTCGLCGKIFNDISALSLHFLKHALVSTSIINTTIEAEFFFCEICGETFESESFLFKHYNEEHEGKPTWPCLTCSEIFEKEIDLLKHLTIHVRQSEENSPKEVEEEEEEETDNILCVLCHGTFSSKQSLLKHSIEHLMKKYTCKKCSLSFCTQHSYSEHFKLHATHQYSCPTCAKVLSSKSALKSHIVGVHSVDLRHTCSTCGKSFATLTRLRTHSQIHKKTKKYICSYCGYSAHKVGDLQIHTRIHTSERPYKCTFANCSASFKTSSHLCEHVRRHLQIRKFKCSICLATFSTSHSLKVHHLQHTGERPHSCSVCHQRFRRKYHVSVHMKQHQVKTIKTEG